MSRKNKTRQSRTLGENNPDNKNRNERENKKGAKQSKLNKAVALLAVTPLVLVTVTASIAAYRHLHSGNTGFNTQQLTPAEKVASIGGVEFLESGESADTKLAMFFDPICGGCGKFERALGETFESLVQKGEVQMLLAPMNFLDRVSTDKYSSRAGSAVVSMHQDDPVNALHFMRLIYSEGFQPHEGSQYKPVSNREIADVARNITKVKDSALIEKRIEETSYADWITNNTAKAIESKEFFPSKDDFGTPALFIIQGDSKPVEVEFSPNKGIKESLTEAIEKAKSQWKLVK